MSPAIWSAPQHPGREATKGSNGTVEPQIVDSFSSHIQIGNRVPPYRLVRQEMSPEADVSDLDVELTELCRQLNEAESRIAEAKRRLEERHSRHNERLSAELTRSRAAVVEMDAAHERSIAALRADTAAEVARVTAEEPGR
jgi:hypothetical protein